MNEAMIMIKNELGKDAIILSSRKVKPNGLFGIFGKSKFEVLAAIEDQVQLKTAENNLQSTDRDKSVIDTYMKVKNQSSSIEKNAEMNQMNQDLSELKQMVNQLVNQQNGMSSEWERPIGIKNEEILNASKSSFTGNIALNQTISSPVDQVKEWLMERDVEKVHADKIADILFFNGETPEDLSSSLRQVIQKLLGKPYVIEKTSSKPKICLFVGPTGVGKTTTLAKLAAKLSLI